MKPYTRSIINLFDGKRRYLIPLYQRQYSWRNDPQIAQMWSDIERAVEIIETDRTTLVPHFMGAIVISQVVTYGEEVQAFVVIDGQQRLTTFQLLLAALRDVAKEYESRYETELQKYLLNDGVMHNEEVERYKLWPSKMDQKAFVKIIDPAIDLSVVGGLEETDPLVGRLASLAYQSFLDRILDHVKVNGVYQEKKLQILFEALKDGLQVVSIELENGDDPQTIFETLNSRGVTLTPADLLRNFIFQRSTGNSQTDGILNIDRLYERHWLPLDRHFWKLETSRGRQTQSNINWMLTDHLSMILGKNVSISNLFSEYRKWILDKKPFATVNDELEAITSTAKVEQRLFKSEAVDPVGNFGKFASAFEISTAMPLVIYLATEIDVECELIRALEALKSYILRRDICGLTTKNFNKFFISIITILRKCEGNKVKELITYLSDRESSLERWPDNSEWQHSWLVREQYSSGRQARLRYIFEAIERAKQTTLTENIVIDGVLTIEHIMPQKWKTAWTLPGMEGLTAQEYGPDLLSQVSARNSAVNQIGNLTLMTRELNATVANSAFSVKIPAIAANSALTLNREIANLKYWDENSIQERGQSLFEVARKIWQPPQRADIPVHHLPQSYPSGSATVRLPANGTICYFTYSGKENWAEVIDRSLIIKDVDGKHGTFSAASKAISGNARNGWKDWMVDIGGGEFILADDWRKSLM